MPDIENKLVSARTRLILDKPFLGALVLRLPMMEGAPSWCNTTFSDGRTFYYNAEYINSLDIDQTQFALSHEALHCALSHFYRRGHRIKTRWDLACDYAVNPMLINDGLKPTPDAAYLKQYRGMTAEEIYPCLDDEEDEQEQDSDTDDNEDLENKHQGDAGSDDSEKEPEQDDRSDPEREPEQDDPSEGTGNNRHGKASSGSNGAAEPEPMSGQQQEDLNTQWQQRLAAAAQTAHQRGQLGVEMARMVDFLLQPKLPWRLLLQRYMSMTARDDYSYSRPSSRRGNPAVYPRLRSSETSIVVVIDTSGSISEEEIGEFISEIDAIKSYVRARITLLTCDSELNHGCPWYFDPWDEFSRDIEIHGGGGTSFSPPFEWIENQDRAPDLLVYFTDARGKFPPAEPMYPVLWLVKGQATVPFGQRVQLN
ncbi:MAG: VWA-like domain-containing protein [Gammaproteobacteria bacterium]|nr:VWA-like domain-containing protein [Gammaproteobacteria bacterium]MDX2486637.1 VWA-like domain-containing protein [Gammaproteobacteria bacterium]